MAAKAQVTALLGALGHDAVDIGSLADSWRSRPGVPTPASRVKEPADRATPEK